jgi:hypothetical protein
MSNPYDETVICRKCGRSNPPYQTVRLWDGCDYCVDCVDAAHPEMAAIARRHRPLQDTMPWSAREVAAHCLWRTVRLGFLCGCVLVALGWLLSSEEMRPAGRSAAALTVGILGLFTLVSMLAGAFYYYFIVGTFDSLRLTVSIWDGRLIISNRMYGDGIDVPLSACDWHLGKVREGHLWWMRTGMCRWGYPRAPAIVLTFVSHEYGWLFRSRNSVPVGYCDESRNLWQAFLELADVARRR